MKKYVLFWGLFYVFLDDVSKMIIFQHFLMITIIIK